MNATPLVSIIVPSWNQGRFIARTLDSILSQDYRPLEIVVMDGGSKDETVEVLKKYSHHPELRWRSEPDKGVADAVNKGLAEARGEIAGIQASDDIYYPGAVRRAVEAFRQHPDVGLLYGDSDAIDADDRLLWQSHWAPFSLENFFLGISQIPQASAFFRMDLARAVGGWDPSYFIADYEYWLRMLFRTRVIKLEHALSAARVHEVRRDTEKRKIWDAYWRMIRQSPDLRAAPRRVRQAAEAGAHALILRHDPYQRRWRVAWHCTRAILAHPRGYLAVRHALVGIPGFRQLERAARRLRRRLPA